MSVRGNCDGPNHGLPSGDPVIADFFARPAECVAPDLVGKILWRKGVGGGRLTEVEAYLPHDDPACHAARGRTKRNGAMFGPPGSVYVYLSYGVHVLLNLVCDLETVGAAVLIRSFEPLEPIDGLARNRNVERENERGDNGYGAGARDGRHLSCGPGRVGQALGLELGLSGTLLGEQSGLYVVDDGVVPQVGQTTRVGISKGCHLPLRFYMVGSSYVSHGT